MEKASVNVTKFNSNDVIATSLHITIGPDNVEVIWLDLDGVEAYNKSFNSGNSFPLAFSSANPDVTNYYAYSGTAAEGLNGGTYYQAMDHTTTKPPKVNYLRESDTELFNLINQWLIKNTVLTH